METGETSTFYVFASPTGEPCQSPATVFYKVETELLAETLCALFRKEYTDKDGRPAFHCIPAASISAEEQVLLDEALDWLPLYNDPDPGVYAPPPSEQTLFLAQYMIRASDWERLLGQQSENSSSSPGHTGVEKDRTQKAGPTKGACDSDGVGHDGPGFNKDSPTTDDISDIPPEERRNSDLYLLMLLAQAYYKMLECTVSMASWCTMLDLELNGYYLWAVQCMTNLLKNSENLKDFPVPFEPLFPDLYPTTIRDYDWEDGVAPEVEQFLSAVQKYVQSKGIYEPEKGSVGWVFIELFRPSVNAAIEKATAYNKRMRQHMRKALDCVSPKADDAAPTTHGEQPAPDADKAKKLAEAQPEQSSKPTREAGVTEQKDIWEDISPDMKGAIQDFWRESKAKKSDGRRLMIKEFCQERRLDEETFKSEKDRVEKRKKRPGWADQ